MRQRSRYVYLTFNIKVQFLYFYIVILIFNKIRKSRKSIETQENVNPLTKRLSKRQLIIF